MGAHDAEPHIRVSIAPDRLAATASIAPGCPASLLTPESVAAVLRSREVQPARIDAEAIADLVDRARAAPDAPAEAVVARGIPPTPGDDGRFEPDPPILEELARAAAVRTSGEERRHDQPPPADGTGDGDYYSRSGFVVVPAGRRLGVIVPPTAGEDGTDVLGRAVPSKPGREASVRMEGAAADGDGNVAATIAGVLTLRVGEIVVSPDLEVDGSVDFSAGNIDFPGDVRVRGGVRDRFSVVAGGSIDVRELVEATTLVAGRDITLHVGMAGREKGSLQAGRDLTARYLDGCRARVGRHCRVDREIDKSSIDIDGEMDSPRCSLRGGAIRVAGLCRLGEIGGEAGVETAVYIGVLAELEDLLRQADELRPAIERRAADAREKLDQLRHNARRLPPALAEQITELEYEANSTGTLVHRLDACCERLQREYAQASEPVLEVMRLVHPGVRVLVRGWAVEFREEVRGPLRLTVTADGAPLLVDPRTGEALPHGKRLRVHKDPSVRRLQLPDNPAQTLAA